MTEVTRGLTEKPVKITSPYDKQLETTLKVHEWTADEQSSRTWRILAKWWIAALLAALVPPHIPWFTIAFLGGPIAAWLASRQGAMIQKQDVTCPDCGAQSSIEEQPETWPLGARCSPCRTVFWISPVQPPVAAR
jgi:hypothetical protein